MNDNEGVAEMLIESMGTTIVNTTDSKGRWEIQIDLNRSRLSCWGVHKHCCYIVNCVCVDAGLPFTLQLFLIMWSVSPFYWATELRQM